MKELIRSLLILTVPALFLFSCTGKTLSKVKSGEDNCIVDVCLGEVMISQDSGKQWISVASGDLLKEYDLIETKDKSYCDVVIPKMGLFRVSENSRVTIFDILSKNSQLKLSKGKVQVKLTNKLEQGNEFKIETSSAVAAVRGTEFIIQMDGDHMKTVVKKGRVALKRNIPLNTTPEMKTAPKAVCQESPIPRTTE